MELYKLLYTFSPYSDKYPKDAEVKQETYFAKYEDAVKCADEIIRDTTDVDDTKSRWKYRKNKEKDMFYADKGDYDKYEISIRKVDIDIRL